VEGGEKGKGKDKDGDICLEMKEAQFVWKHMTPG
jgi:hypothetical protein